VFDFKLSDGKMGEIEALDTGERIDLDPDGFVRP